MNAMGIALALISAALAGCWHAQGVPVMSHLFAWLSGAVLFAVALRYAEGKR